MIKRKNKRGVIGTTLTWIVAIFIIVFILGVFIVIVFILVLDNYFSINPSAEINENSHVFVFDQTVNLISFVKENKKFISDWADDGFILSYEDSLSGKTDEKMEILCSKIQKYTSSFKLDINELYFKSGEEGFIAEINSDEFVCRLIPPNQPVVSFGQEYRINSQVFIFSDNGNKVQLLNLKK